MSLQVWLPLTKDLRQQGISNVTVTNNGATFNSAGKLGGCYYFNGDKQWLQFSSVLGEYYNNDWSIACWLKPTDSTRSVIISEYNTSGASNVGLELTTSRVVRLYWNGSPDINFTTAGALSLNEWTHLVVTKAGRVVKVYFNGELKQTYTNSSDFSTRTSAAQPRIGDDYRGNSANTVSYQGYINDFRMYNHCLSPMEVKQLSQGLVLHYPLNRRGWGQENLLHNTHDFTGRSASNTTIVTDSTDGTYAKTTPSTVDWTSIQIGPSFTASLISGKTITVTCEVRAFDLPTSTTTNYCYLTLNAFNSASSFSRVGNKDHSYASNVLKEGEWVTLSYQLDVNFSNWTVNSGYTTSDFQYITLGLYNHSGKRIDFRHPKIELGEIATPWCPNSSDTLATTMGLNGTTEYDTSGYCNNGTRTGTFSWTSDTPKYSVSTQFNSTSTKIQLPVMDFSGMANSYTFAWWQYNISTGNMPWGFSNGNRLNCYHCSPLCWNTGDGSSNQFKDGSATVAPTTVQNGWHHMVVIGDGTATKLYIDGVYKGTATTYKPLTGTQIWISGWDSGTSYTFNGSKECDFRIYATALSAEDVKQLYNSNRL